MSFVSAPTALNPATTVGVVATSTIHTINLPGKFMGTSWMAVLAPPLSGIGISLRASGSRSRKERARVADQVRQADLAAALQRHPAGRRVVLAAASSPTHPAMGRRPAGGAEQASMDAARAVHVQDQIEASIAHAKSLHPATRNAVARCKSNHPSRWSPDTDQF